MKKICFKCSELKPLTEYYKQKRMKDGHMNKCKECTKMDVHRNRALNIEKIREYDRKRGQTQERKTKNKEYADRMRSEHPEKWKEMRKKATNKYRENNRDKHRAERILFYHKSIGKIQQKPCEICGDIKSEAHHPDYSKPLDVVWLCDFHHKEEHKKLRAQERGEI